MRHPVPATIERDAADRSEALARVRALLDAAFGQVQRSPMRGLEMAREAHRLSIAFALPDERAEALRTIAYCHQSVSEYSVAMPYARASLRLCRTIGSNHGAANALMAIGIVARDQTRYPDALDAFNHALAIFRQENDRLRIAAAYNNIGVVHAGICSYAAALEAYLAALRIYEEEGEEEKEGIAAGNISNIYFALGDVDRSYEYCRRALEIAERAGTPVGRAVLLGNISSIYKARGDHDAALGAVDEALRIFVAHREKRYEATTLAKLGMLYELRGDDVRALAAHRRSERIGRSVGSREVYLDAMFRIAELYQRRGRHRRALEIAVAGAAEAAEAQLSLTECNLRVVAARCAEAVGQTDIALANLWTVIELRSTLFSHDRQKTVAEMQARFDVERTERQREVLLLKNRHLEELMEQKTQELTSMALSLVGKNRLLQQIHDVGDRLAASDGTAPRSGLTEILSDVRATMHNENDWKRFEREFENAHSDFLRRMAERFPRLTPMELKVCALLKLNLSTKEIANLLYVSTRNVEGHRYWIRKKMALPSDVNLSSYLAAL